MDISTFFKKFDQFADAPGAVAKLRELVLELAVRGRLSERRPKDQDDAVWRAFLSKFDNRIYGSEPGPPPPFEIPEEWRWVTLDDLGSTRVRNEAEDDCEASFIPMALVPLRYGDAPKSEKRAWREIKKAFTHFAEGDVVMAKITPCFENGKSAVVRNLINGIGAGTTELHVFRPGTPTVLPEFVLLYIKSRGFITRGERVMTGSAGQKRVPRDYFAGSPIPLPPLAEQKRIVAKVDELMALCDRLEAQQQERETRRAALARAALARFAAAPTPANLNFIFHSSFSVSPADLRKSILTLAVQGKLVPQKTNDEPVASVSQFAANPAREQEMPFDLPESWRWVQLGQVSDLINGDRSKNYPNKAEYVRKGVAWINTGHIEPDGTLSVESMHYITRKKFDSLRSGKVRPGDLVYCLRGATLGKTAIITQFDEGAVASSLVIIRLSHAVDPKFAYRFLTSPLGRDQIYKFDNGSAQPNLSANNVKKYWVPLPPLAEQRRIVAKVEQLMALVDALEQQLAASRAIAEKLLTALVAELTTARTSSAPAKERPALLAAEDAAPYRT
jgi:type I restriction enzyme S subunit